MMKKSIFTLILLTVSTLALASGALAADTKSRKSNSAATTAPETHSYVSEPYSSSSNTTFSLGFTTNTPGGVLGSQALSGLIGLSSGDMIDVRFAVPHTTGAFNFGIGGLYKHTISHHGGAGFHAGGGLALGSVGATGGNFAMTLAAIGGFHFNLPSISAIQVHLDGGPAFTLVSTSPSSTTDFSIQTLSPLLGMSIYYTF